MGNQIGDRKMINQTTQNREAARPLITGDGIAHILQQIAGTCRVKADALDEAFLKRADPRAVQGGAICEDASEWRQLSTQLKRLALGAKELAD